tara:strand:- start:2378 stop:2545 length:168 start_codon:yes stop_codon:yes gene_type:complete
MADRVFKNLRRIVRSLNLDGDQKQHYKRLKKIYLKTPADSREEFLKLIQNNKNYE